MLPAEQVLALRDLQMADQRQEELSRLLAEEREHRLEARRRERLEELLAAYRQRMVRKAQALKVAVGGVMAPVLRSLSNMTLPPSRVDVKGKCTLHMDGSSKRSVVRAR